jgi:hypothetical protein
MGIFLALLILLGAGLVASFWIPWWRVKKITIDGAVDVAAATRIVEQHIRQPKALVLPQDNYFFVPSKDIIEAFKDNMIGIAYVEQKFPDSLHIVFPQWKPVLILCIEISGCFYINADGIIVTKAPAISESTLPMLSIVKSVQDLLRIRLGDSVISPQDVTFLTYMARSFRNHSILLERIDTISLFETFPITEGEYKIITKSGWYILVRASGNQEQIARDLFQLLDEKVKNRALLGYIDMRFPNKAFFKYGSAPLPSPINIPIASSSSTAASATTTSH